MIQIDIIEVCKYTNIVRANLYTGDRCIKIIMDTVDYNAALKDGFFIRDGLTFDSAKVLNTTKVYKIENK